MWKGFCLGLLVGWLVEWLIDWMFWRRNRYAAQASIATHYAGAGTYGPLTHGGTATTGTAPAPLATAANPSGTAGAATAGAAWAPYGQEQLEAIEGIGPKIAELLRAAGITTFRRLADTPTVELARILEQAGPRFRLADPATWCEQADLAARGDWAGFEALKEKLVAGVRKSADPDAGQH